MFEGIVKGLESAGQIMRGGNIVDATIINTPSSTKNKKKERDPEMKQTIAILLNELKNRYAARLYQSIILFPYLISLIVTSYLVYAILSIDTGLLNNVVTRLGGNKVIQVLPNTDMRLLDRVCQTLQMP